MQKKEILHFESSLIFSSKVHFPQNQNALEEQGNCSGYKEIVMCPNHFLKSLTKGF